MSITLLGIIGILTLLFIIFVFGIPVGFAMGLIGFVGFWYVLNMSAATNMLAHVIWDTFSSYGLTVIPLFIFMGQVAFYSGINEKLYNAAHKWVGNINGGLAIATIMACSAFSAICGSNAATAATMTTVALPQMKRFKYNTMLSTGAIATGSTLGVVIPPSVVLIIYGLSAEQSIAKLFYGGFGAGILLTLLLALTVYVLCKIFPTWGPVGEKADLKEKIRSLSGAVEMLFLFALVMAGLFIGLFTPTEAGAVGSLFAVLIALLQKKLTWEKFYNIIYDTLKVSCMVFVIITGAMVFGKFLAITRIPFDIATWVIGLPFSPVAILSVIFLIYVMGGMVMDSLALLLITIPIFYPVSVQLGYDPIWFGVMITVITTMGAITPPVGATAYVVSGIAKDVPLEKVFQGILCFIPAYILAIILMMIFPEIITYLPGLMK
jgi:C4-dicarboxylate transporter, DctM subunit